MAFQIISSKVQTVIVGKRKVTSRRGSDKGRIVEKQRRFKATIGTYIEFSDGWTIQGPDGRIHTGKGTVVRFNYRHGTWSVQRPQRCETNVLGYVFSPQGEPCWLKADRESGFTTPDFRRSFSAGFVKLCETGNAQARSECTGH